jgi:hypothetical protein
LLKPVLHLNQTAAAADLPAGGTFVLNSGGPI